MEIAYWAERWKDGRIGFHEGRANALLERFHTTLHARPSDHASADSASVRTRVLVPLCGKTEDMAFLVAHGFDVVGVEAVESAAIDFFREHELTPSIEDHSATSGGFGGKIFRAPSIAIVVGDFFAVTPALVGEGGAVTAFYDRAAMVALPPDVRPRYAKHLRSLVAPDAKGLVITFDLDKPKTEGPPFSIDGDELRATYGEDKVEELGQDPPAGPSVKADGTTELDRCFAVRLA